MSPPAADRLACLTPGCPNTIQPATAARTGGYCGPCAGRRDRAARDAYIRANRRDVSRYAGVTDPVDLLRLMHTPPKPDPLVNLLPPPRSFEELYLSLTSQQATRLMNVATELASEGEHDADHIGLCLAAFTDFPLDPMLDAWLDHDRAYPALMFRGAGPRVRDRLLALLQSDPPSLLADHALSALAWIGDEATVDYMRRADVERPEWARPLHLAPTGYTRTAGWELRAGGRRELTFHACAALHVAAEGEPHTDQVRVMQYRTDTCPWCGCKLADLIEARLTDPPLDALRQLGPRIEVATCPICTCFGPVHAELDPHGHARWAANNVRPGFLPPDARDWGQSPWSHATVRLPARRPVHAADWCLPTTLSQVGGHPAWVQDVEYPVCLKCGRTMMFLAQVDQAAFPGHEGVYYAFVCAQCRTTATTYQQT